MFRSELLAFVKAVWRHWKWVVGGATVAFCQVCYGIWQQEPRPVVSWILLAIGLSCAVFLAWRDEYRSTQKLLAARDTARDECLNISVGLLKKYPIFMLPMHAVYRAKAYKLESNDDLLWICSELEKHGHADPFLGFEEFIPASERLEFLKWARKQNGIDLSKGNSFVTGADAWPKLKGRLQPPFYVAGRPIKPRLNWEMAGREDFIDQLPPYDD
jgi:hypothetical protein